MNPSRRGFTLIELSIVLVIVSLLVGGGILMGGNAIKSAERVTTQQRLETIKTALDAYVKANGYLPCATDRALTPTANPTSFGREIRPCTAAAPGLVRVGGTVDIGGVPVRSLGLPDNYAADAWGNKFTYAVSVALTTAYRTADAAITVSTGDRTGTSYNVTTTTNRATLAITNGPGAAYVVLSHGPDGRGAFPLKSSSVGVACGAGSQNDVENCNDSNATFWDTTYNDGAISASFFDDFIVWAGNALDRTPISTAPTTCGVGGACEAWCAPCAGTTSDLPTGGAGIMTPGTAILCKKIITSSSPCQATCLWGGTVSATTQAVRCP